MASICYSWNDAIFSWNNAPLTWSEFCVVQKIISSRNKTVYHKKDRNEKVLTQEEEEILINLIVRLKAEGLDYESKLQKIKNNNISLKIDDLDIFMNESQTKTISIKINL